MSRFRVENLRFSEPLFTELLIHETKALGLKKLYAAPGQEFSQEHLSKRLANGARIDRSGCWVWTRTCNRRGYGTLTLDGRAAYAHRLSYQLSRGDVGANQVLHRCDNPPCINPDHLFLGSVHDNMADAWSKGRGRVPAPARLCGEENPQARLTRSNARAIRAARGESQRAIGARFGVSQALVSRILRGKIWK